MSVKLPKQWRHWCRKAGLRPEGFTKNDKSNDWRYLNGCGRKWRITLRDIENQDDCIFQAGDTHDKFARWAVSERRNFEIPKNWREFKAAVDSVCGLTTLKVVDVDDGTLDVPVKSKNDLGISDVPFPADFVPRFMAMNEDGCWNVFVSEPICLVDQRGQIMWSAPVGLVYEIGIDDSDELIDTPEFARGLPSDQTLFKIAG